MQESLPLEVTTHAEFALYLSRRPDRTFYYGGSGWWFLQDKPIGADMLRKYIFNQIIEEYQDYQSNSENPSVVSDIKCKCMTVRFQLAVMQELKDCCRVY